MIQHVVFLLEEPSAQDFLNAVIPFLIPSHVQVHFMVFEGKQDLEKQMPRKLKSWVRPQTRFVVLRDQDSGDCKAIKSRLKAICVAASRPDAIVRIACRELESFFVGDWSAVALAFDRPALASQARSAKFREPDMLGSPSHELARLIPEYQKRDRARRISPHLDYSRNRSKSFQALWRTLQSVSVP
ncbi:DUF4276 family protein [Acidovorax sp. GBBC 3334]|uniref:DUF4276 family protein n=1 Tax=Acidovorax sp. GBBC 3334 TaxID=2940496 RepID=UPI0023036920|nr:DUF4276 family protein [Acidovorax sp. GBBC 3334]MDA8456210.1 DUF4276 family protein [Acidovorax sp. GBBC 3334]